jgi:hypothetical protein
VGQGRVLAIARLLLVSIPVKIGELEWILLLMKLLEKGGDNGMERKTRA